MNNYIGIGEIATNIVYKEFNNKAIGSTQVSINNSLVPIKMYGKIASNVYKYLNKGSKVAIRGSIQTNEKKGLEILVNSITFLSSKKIEA